jgi:hypothetical protein
MRLISQAIDLYVTTVIVGTQIFISKITNTSQKDRWLGCILISFALLVSFVSKYIVYRKYDTGNEIWNFRELRFLGCFNNHDQFKPLLFLQKYQAGLYFCPVFFVTSLTVNISVILIPEQSCFNDAAAIMTVFLTGLESFLFVYLDQQCRGCDCSDFYVDDAESDLCCARRCSEIADDKSQQLHEVLA